MTSITILRGELLENCHDAGAHDGVLTREIPRKNRRIFFGGKGEGGRAPTENHIPLKMFRSMNGSIRVYTLKNLDPLFANHFQFCSHSKHAATPVFHLNAF